MRPERVARLDAGPPGAGLKEQDSSAPYRHRGGELARPSGDDGDPRRRPLGIARPPVGGSVKAAKPPRGAVKAEPVAFADDDAGSFVAGFDHVSVRHDCPRKPPGRAAIVGIEIEAEEASSGRWPAVSRPPEGADIARRRGAAIWHRWRGAHVLFVVASCPPESSVPDHEARFVAL